MTSIAVRGGSRSYWIDDLIPRFDRLRDAITVDVAIVGGGITGLTAAYLLKRRGHRVALLERDRIAAVASGHTTAHLTFVTDRPLSDLVRNFGFDHGPAVWDAGQAALNLIHDIVRKEEIECDFSWVPGYLHQAPDSAHSELDRKKLRLDATLARNAGFDATFSDSQTFLKVPGIRFANQAKFHPRRYLSALAGAIHGGGSFVFGDSAVTLFKEDPLSLESNGHEVRCGHVVIATNAPLQGNAGAWSSALLQTKLFPYNTYAIRATIPKGSIEHALYWDTAEPYHYLRVDSSIDHDTVIFGGEDHKTGQDDEPEKHLRSLEERLRSTLPVIHVTHRWSGQVIETADGLPYIGPTSEHQFVGTGYGGNGMTFGTLAGLMASEAITHLKNPWSDLFSVRRTKLRGSAFDYIRENLDYPYYLVKDRFRALSTRSPDDLRAGEGALVEIEGQQIAAFRDESGRLSLLKPVCTHLGCLVHWNEAEKTWDCPCHGSRYHPTGEVLSGPAEVDLHPAHPPAETRLEARDEDFDSLPQTI